jgi:hypothetical protein
MCWPHRGVVLELPGDLPTAGRPAGPCPCGAGSCVWGGVAALDDARHLSRRVLGTHSRQDCAVPPIRRRAGALTTYFHSDGWFLASCLMAGTLIILAMALLALAQTAAALLRGSAPVRAAKSLCGSRGDIHQVRAATDPPQLCNLGVVMARQSCTTRGRLLVGWVRWLCE